LTTRLVRPIPDSGIDEHTVPRAWRIHTAFLKHDAGRITESRRSLLERVGSLDGIQENLGVVIRLLNHPKTSFNHDVNREPSSVCLRADRRNDVVQLQGQLPRFVRDETDVLGFNLGLARSLGVRLELFGSVGQEVLGTGLFDELPDVSRRGIIRQFDDQHLSGFDADGATILSGADDHRTLGDAAWG
jgi:hypothetical protein